MKLVIEVNKEDYKRYKEDKVCSYASAVLDAVPLNEVLDGIKAEIEKSVWEDVIVSLDGTDEVRIPRLEPDDVFEIIDKYKAENEDKRDDRRT